MKRIVAIMADLAGAVFLAAGIMMKVKSQREVSVIGETMVIGGMDGPTSIFIAAKANHDTLNGGDKRQQGGCLKIRSRYAVSAAETGERDIR